MNDAEGADDPDDADGADGAAGAAGAESTMGDESGVDEFAQASAMPASAELEQALQQLGRLHAEVEREANALAARHASRLACRRGCHDCCIDGLTVVRLEAERIRRAHPALLAEGEPHPIGRCAFLDAEGACRIYAERPLVCRTQGLPLRLFFENEADEIEERRDVCPLNFTSGPPLESLEERDCWLIGPHELRLASLDEAAGGSDETRVALRDLFGRR